MVRFGTKNIFNRPGRPGNASLLIRLRRMIPVRAESALSGIRIAGKKYIKFTYLTLFSNLFIIELIVSVQPETRFRFFYAISTAAMGRLNVRHVASRPSPYSGNPARTGPQPHPFIRPLIFRQKKREYGVGVIQ